MHIKGNVRMFSKCIFPPPLNKCFRVALCEYLFHWHVTWNSIWTIQVRFGTKQFSSLSKRGPCKNQMNMFGSVPNSIAVSATTSTVAIRCTSEWEAFQWADSDPIVCLAVCHSEKGGCTECQKKGTWSSLPAAELNQLMPNVFLPLPLNNIQYTSW